MDLESSCFNYRIQKPNSLLFADYQYKPKMLVDYQE